MSIEKNNEDKIKKFLDFKKINNKSRKEKISEKTIDLYKRNLKYLFDSSNKYCEDITEDDILEVLKGKSVYTINSRIITYKMFFKWLYNIGKNEPLPQCVKRLETRSTTKNEIKYREKTITEAEKDLLINHCYKPIHKALIECAWLCGARKGAVQAIKSDGIYYDGEFTHIIIPISKTETREFEVEGRYEHLLLWVETLQPFKGQKGKPLFAVKKPHTKDKYKQVNEQYLSSLITRVCEKAGIKHITPHYFRHNRITKMLAEGIPETHIKTLMGLSKDTQMLKIYDHNKNEDYEKWCREKRVNQPDVSYKALKKEKQKIENEYEKRLKKLEEKQANMIEMLAEIEIFGEEETLERCKEKDRYKLEKLIDRKSSLIRAFSKK